ncbi:glycerol-1-phosphate dehydrogenase [NAD(P)+] [Paenibacillus barengoltzii J12]|uniref:Glycerol-1-phosphate dehydrogenase [NAD(P)+] n=1 Tax=Paenibacillus barengoltzii J12 TaxID=935846 RepID=A0ABY1LUM5_9BACL|nr:sn-glycerol-1-phosphate dehydrogenase [Paenibacillus barengoltzii]SME90737.1 glycerol-1-phosphate dehydrogenase [NAD(P)+] [Paenibacillus barengoltzii J12]
MLQDRTLEPLKVIELDRGVIRKVAPYLREQGYRQILLVADDHTYAAAGEQLMGLLEVAGVKTRVVLIQPDAQGDVVADEIAIVQLLLEIRPDETDALLAVGSGTIHDIVRFAAHKTGKPFVSVPTAPSVDGFTSAGAPLIVRGVKKTVPAVPPVAIFADLDILMAAPQRLVAAGFGDMLGKYTSLFDWKFSHLTAGEPYDEQAAAITERALRSCVSHAEAIGARTEEGIRALMTALIESGIAMLLFGQSHPASGAEHHLSHYWEMEYLRQGRRALLHGAKVGVACAEIARVYHAAGEGTLPGAEPAALREHREQVRAWLRDLPGEAELRGLLRQAGGPSTLAELGVGEELFARSLREAHRVRDRRTLLRALNEAEQA